MKRWLPGLAIVFAMGCGDSGPTALDIPIGSLEFTVFCGTLIEGQQCNLEGRVLAKTPEPEEQVIANPVLRWSSNSASVSVTSSGLVTAVTAGEARITVTNSTGTVSASQAIRVIPANPK